MLVGKKKVVLVQEHPSRSRLGLELTRGAHVRNKPERVDRIHASGSIKSKFVNKAGWMWTTFGQALIVPESPSLTQNI